MTHEIQSLKSFQRDRHLSYSRKDKQDTPITSKLDEINNQMIGDRGLFLHPTKGYRRASTISTVCSDIVTGIKTRGVKISVAEMGEQIRLARKSQYNNKGDFRKHRRTKP